MYAFIGSLLQHCGPPTAGQSNMSGSYSCSCRRRTLIFAKALPEPDGWNEPNITNICTAPTARQLNHYISN
jgi:hypothetical protein